MKRRLACAATCILLGCGVAAQERSRVDRQTDERLRAYLRTGQYAEATRLIDQMLAIEPREDLKNVRAIFGGAPTMRVRHASGDFRCDVTDTGVSLPLTVNGARVQWLSDTGANVTMISDAEAARLGLMIRDSEGRAADLAGGSTGIRTAIAEQVVIGRTRLENVLFLVMPAQQMPWKELAAGRQGILGLPVMVALDALDWKRGGMCRTGLIDDLSRRRPANLRYDGLQVITTVTFGGRELEFVLDTGNQSGTQLWERFGKDFEPLVKERGRPGSARVTQIGGSTDRPVTVIPDVRLDVGGRTTNLPHAQLFSRPVGDDRFHGLLGMDVLSQATDVTIDFRSMKLTLQ
ncbi:MAG TPA: pepsin/retropepsin-like aspartic protease family protein [Vicinamibacterales bacterium]|nr:pepsin/retropepsin-like aspartic protease family protein [Vicinamibacterales bacterium]